MEIAVLGTGIVGRTIAKKLVQLGHHTTIGTRDVGNTLGTKGQDGTGNASFKEWYAENSQVKLQSFREASKNAGIIFNCTGGQATLTALDSIGDQILADRILIDVANPLDFSNGMPPSLSPVNTDSLGEQIQRRFPELRVVKSLNTMNTQLMVSPSSLEGDHNVFVCGNDEAAKRATKELLKEFGWRENLIIDLGDITNARGTEMLLPIWLRLWNSLGTANFNFHIQRG